MIDISSINAISGILAAVGVVVGVVFAVLQLRDLVKTRRTDLVMRLHSSAISKEFMEAVPKIMSLEFDDYNDYVKKYGIPWFSENPANTAFLIVGIFLEDVGLLLYRRLVDIDLVGELYPVSMLWEKMKPVIEGMRKQFNSPRIYEWFEYFEARTRLYVEKRKREQRPPTIIQ